MTPAFRAALAAAAAGMFLFVAGVSITGTPYRAVGLAGAATGALLLAAAFPRLWSAMPGLPTGRIDPPIQPRTEVVRRADDLFADLPDYTPTQPPPGVDPTTGEVLPDRLDALEADMAALRALFAEQSDLIAAGYAALRQELNRDR